jgi:hypothetical protein
MPLANLGSLFLDNVVFLIHLLYVHIALTHAEPNQIFMLHLLSSLGNRRPDNLETPPWPPLSVVPW